MIKKIIDLLKGIKMKRPAFTMIELVMVIVVLGILAALAIPRMERDLRQEAKDNVLSAIRYTQHLALIDDKTDPTNNDWQANLWKISFDSNTSYTISSGSTIALDPVNGKAMDGTSPNTLIGKKYSVNKITGTCTTVGFDNLGRPFTSFSGSVYAGYMGSAPSCNIIVEFEGGITDLTITIAAETGYVSGD